MSTKSGIPKPTAWMTDPALYLRFACLMQRHSGTADGIEGCDTLILQVSMPSGHSKR
jgi:hypothetical protein